MVGSCPGGWLEGGAGTWRGVLRSICSPAHSCGNTEQKNVLLPVWIGRNEQLNKETLRGFMVSSLLLNLC